MVSTRFGSRNHNNYLNLILEGSLNRTRVASPRSGIGAASNPPPAPRTPSISGRFPTNVRRRLSSPGPSRFLSSHVVVPQPRVATLSREAGNQEDLARSSRPRKYIGFWCPRLRKKDGALCIEGRLLEENMSISEQPYCSTRVVSGKGKYIRVHGRSGTEVVLEGRMLVKETSFSDILHSTSNTPICLLDK